MLHNKCRIVEVWFDEYSRVFYDAVGHKRGSINYGDIRERLKTKYQKQVHSFEWFLKRFKFDLSCLRSAASSGNSAMKNIFDINSI